ncbi:uncharacterized protein LOC122926834 [Bufo gargarizans]|uniref:uncharacterized protein LOC122926834 n=1 Tax=Bufo gargarizans TaxID=30331 RepID=UPI001CF15F4F|nr:uncharacterized protein LOC122926834 [Bufo gargarizans]
MNDGNKKIPNLSNQEIAAIKSLQKNDAITIRPADKGGAIVILNTEDYNRECCRQLTDVEVYTRLTMDPINEFYPQLVKLCEKGAGANILLESEAKFILNTQCRLPVFNYLPKVDKCLTAPPGRPIISGINSLTANLSQYVDHQLQPIVKDTKCYLKNTTQIIKILENLTIDHDCTLSTLDVQSLYTSIRHEQGLQALSSQMHKSGRFKSIQIDFILEAVNFILKHNYFVFNTDFFLQKSGTAMGTRFAPSYANIFMSDWEDEVILPKLGADLVLWKRYIDDVVFIWRGSDLALNSFLAEINRNNLNLHFTSNISKTHIEF